MAIDTPILDRMLAELGRSSEGWENEESLADDRAGIRPSEFVQQKFLSLTLDMALPVSSLHAARSVRR